MSVLIPLEQVRSFGAAGANGFAWGANLLLGQGNWSRMGDKFSGSEAKFGVGEAVSIVAACLAAGALIWLLHWLARRQETSSTRPHPRRLFRELCRAHGLSPTERRLLQRLAVLVGANQPAEVFVQPEWFSADAIPTELADKKKSLEVIAQTLFAEPPARAGNRRSDAHSVRYLEKSSEETDSSELQSAGK